MTNRDALWMTRALAEAERGRGRVEPNPLVGAVIIHDGTIVGVGHHNRFGGPHAEIVALDEAGARSAGASLYVTLEPCCHFGKTPPCVDAILAAGITRVVAAIRDPFPKVAGGGLSRLRDAGLEVVIGVEADAARRINAPYLKRLVTGRPYVTAKWAMSLDGKTALSTGESQWISSPRSRSLVHELRGRMDGVLVGIGTALADDPQLTARPPGPKAAARIVLDSFARLRPDSRLAATARETPVLVAVCEGAPRDRRDALTALGCELIAFDGNRSVPIHPLLDQLGRRGLTNLLVEGGGRVLGAFLDAEEVDAVDVYVGPLVLGGEQSLTPAGGAGRGRMADVLRLAEHQVSVIDGDVRIRGTISRPWQDVSQRLT